MTDPQPAALVELLLSLKIAVAQLRLFRPESAQVQKVIGPAHQALSSHLAAQGELTLARTDQGLLINGKTVPGSPEVVKRMELSAQAIFQDVPAKTITFRKGFTPEEFITFLHALTKRFWDVKDGKEINRRLREGGVALIAVDEVEYVAVAEGETVVKGSLAEGGGERVAALVRSLDQIIASSVEQGVAEQVRTEIMKKILEQDPTGGARAPAAERLEPPAPAPEPVSQDGRITFEETREALGEIARLMKGLEGPGREGLRRIGHILIGGFKHDPTLMALLRTFLTAEAVDLLPAWMKEGAQKAAAETPAVKRAKEVLALGSESQWEAIAPEAGNLCRELASLKQHDLLKEVVTALTGFAHHASAERRAAAGEALAAALPALESEGQEGMLNEVEERNRAALAQERDARAYPIQADLAASLAIRSLARGDYARALESLQLVKKHHRSKEASFPQRSELAYKAMCRVTTSASFPAIVEKLRAQDPEAKKVIEALDAAAARLLVPELKHLEGLRERLEIAQLLMKAGAAAGTVLLEEARNSTIPIEALRLTEVIPHAVPENAAETALGGLLRHPAAIVRRRAAALLTERGYGRSGAFLLEVLDGESDPLSRIAIIEGLGSLRYAGAVDRLCQLAEERSGDEESRAAACLSLGRIGKPEAIPTLVKLCTRGGRGLTRLLSPTGPTLRGAAARALASFTAAKEVREALRQAAEDPNATVAGVAREALYAPLLKAFGSVAKESKMVADLQEAEKENSTLAGSLAEVPLEQLFRLVEGAKKSGALIINFDGPIARIYVAGGFAVAADYEEKTDHEAFADFCQKDRGYFLFQPNEPAPRTSMRESLARMLLQAVRGGAEKGAAPAG